ncbi:hypothetical protein P389DRAFT_26868 [Cystobasidium minutum MCA 4210]|uniref:uncharacterized protein n=1 Tax=Cystobasidium minutum MCA 4210 TaxID=1397322 RepID=UPI0034CFC613|eukprot:jgi/Rhomi1/26868/CE26867_81
MPRRCDTSSQQLVGELERAATPKGHQGGTVAPRHVRSVSTATGARSNTLKVSYYEKRFVSGDNTFLGNCRGMVQDEGYDPTTGVTQGDHWFAPRQRLPQLCH